MEQEENKSESKQIEKQNMKSEIEEKDIMDYSIVDVLKAFIEEE